MRRLSITFLLIFILFTGYISPTKGAVKGYLNYTIPIDYSKLSETELQNKAEAIYQSTKDIKDGIVTEEITDALILYSILHNMKQDNIIYIVRLGTLYDKIGKERYAKSYFQQALSINAKSSITYYYFGEYYYKRNQYRKALRLYKLAEVHCQAVNYDILYKIGDTYAKLGDIKSALQYLKKAEQQNKNKDISSKILYLETLNKH